MVQFCNIQTHLFHYVSEIGYLCLALQRKYRRVISVVGVPYAFGSARYRGFSFSYQMKGIIYIATNLFNGRSYIGQTRGTLDNRIRQHYQDAKKSESVNTFHYALAQYGRSGFEWKVLDEFEGTKEEVIHALNVAEEYHILKSKTRISEGGYNATQGGYASDKFEKAVTRKTTSKSVLQYGLDGIFIKEYESVTEVCRSFGLSSFNNFVARGFWRGFQWRPKDCENYPRKIDPYVRPRRSSAVIVYTTDGNFYKEYESINQCWDDLGASYTLRELKGDRVSIQRHSIGKMLVFRKRGEDYPMKIQVDINYPKGKHKVEYAPCETPVLQYTRDGKFIREYPSIQCAERESGISKQSIRLWCNRIEPLVIRGKKMTKYVWRLKDREIKECIEVCDYKIKGNTPKMEHRVIQYSKDGKFIREWKNLYQASLQTGDSKNLISKQCKGLATRKSSSYLWRFYSAGYPMCLYES